MTSDSITLTSKIIHFRNPAITSKVALFRSEKNRKRMKHCDAVHALVTQVVLHMLDGSFAITIEVEGNDGVPLFEMGCLFELKEPIGAYRCFKIISLLPTVVDRLISLALLSGQKTVDCLMSSDTTGIPTLVHKHDAVMLIGHQVGHQALDAITEEMPPNLEEYLQKLLGAGCDFDRRELVEEVKAQRLVPTAYLRSIGVDHPDACGMTAPS